jgi:hypothetical protein
MRASPRLLQTLRLTPESFKRRLRPAVYQSVRLASRLPGAGLMAGLARHIAPGGYAWLRLRYTHYAEAAALMRQAAPLEIMGAVSPPILLTDDEMLTFARLRSITARSGR